MIGDRCAYLERFLQQGNVGGLGDRCAYLERFL